MSILNEFTEFLLHKKKYWLIPLLAVMIILALFALFFESNAVAPGTYTLF